CRSEADDSQRRQAEATTSTSVPAPRACAKGHVDCVQECSMRCQGELGEVPRGGAAPRRPGGDGGPDRAVGGFRGRCERQRHPGPEARGLRHPRVPRPHLPHVSRRKYSEPAAALSNRREAAARHQSPGGHRSAGHAPPHPQLPPVP
ncbi:hypothetical protein FQN60_005365, partial [Etheostoma spectabile]